MITDEQVNSVIDVFREECIYTNELAAMRKALGAYEQSKPKPKPYGWWSDRYGDWCNEDDKGAFPLYTTPPTREPLSEDFLMKLAEECTTQFFNGVHQNATIHFARAIEQAHGIGCE